LTEDSLESGEKKGAHSNILLQRESQWHSGHEACLVLHDGTTTVPSCFRIKEERLSFFVWFIIP
jgi:hypothetical protein